MTANVAPVAELGGVSERLVAAITAAWRAIRAEHPQVPDVVVMLGSGTIGRRGTSTKLGHFAQARWRQLDPADHAGPAGGHPVAGDRVGDLRLVDQAEVVPRLPVAQAAAGWVPELFVGGEGLRRGPVELLGTLLHEATHGLADVRLIADTSRGGRHHNQRFARLASELGLVATEDGSRGWAHTELAPGTADRYTDVLAHLATVLTVYRRDERPPRPAAGGSTSRNLLAVCACAPPRRIRVARATLDAAPIMCGECGSSFTAAAGDTPTPLADAST